MSDEKRINSKQRVIIICAIAALLLVLVPIVISIVNGIKDKSKDTPDTGELLSGTYSMNAASGAHSGSSGYTFEGNKATNKYNGAEGEVTVEYEYVIAVENGVKVIKFTRLDEEGNPTGASTTHGFYTGLFGEREFISINEVYYYKQ